MVIGKALNRNLSFFTDSHIVTFGWGKFTFGGYTFDDSYIENIRVIGNIYENSDLLFKEEEM